MPIQKQLKVNEQISVSEVRVVDGEEQLGVMSLNDALSLARERGTDLVEVSPNAVPPVCKLLDYGKYMYRQSKIDHRHRVKQKSNEVKEIRLSPRISIHDIETKANQARKFLEKGCRVKTNVLFKGRELSHLDIGQEKLVQFVTLLADISEPESPPKRQGNTISILLKPFH